MYQPPPYPPPPPPPGGSRFLQFGVGGAIVIILISVLGTLAQIKNSRTRKEVSEKKATLPAVGSTGTLAKASPTASLCPGGGYRFGWPCSASKATSVAPASQVRVMKAGMSGTDALCRYWVQGGPHDNASGDAPCEWFVAQ